MATVTYAIPPSVAYVGMPAAGQDQPRVQYFKEASSQSFKRGAPVYLASGLLTANSAGNITTSTTIAGFALEDASGTAGTAIAVAVVDFMRTYKFPVMANDSATTPPADSDIGTVYVGRLVSGYGFCMNKSTTTNGILKYLRPTPQEGYTTSDSGILVECSFIVASGVGVTA